MKGFFYAYKKNGFNEKTASAGAGHFPERSDFGLGSGVPSGASEFLRCSGMEPLDGNSLVLGSPMDQRKSLYGDPSPFGYAVFSVDREARCVTVRRDQMGITPAYFYADSDTLLISNFQGPIVEFLKRDGKDPEIDRQSFYEGFSFKTTPPDRTLFKTIVPVQFGSAAKFRISEDGSPEFLGSEKEFPIDFAPHGRADAYRDYEDEFEKIIGAFPDDEEFTVLFTGGLDSTIILDAAIKLGKKVRAVTAVQEVLKKDDEFAIEYCKKLGIPHDVIKLPTANPFEEYSAAIRDMEDADSVLAGLSITLRAISKEAKAKWYRNLVTGSYIEPILGSNPSTLRTLSILHGNPHFFEPGSLFDPGFRILNDPFSDPEILKTAEKKILSDERFSVLLSSVLWELVHNFVKGKQIPLRPEDFFAEGWLDGVNRKRAVFGDCKHSFGKEEAVFNLLTHSDLAYRGNLRNSLLNEKISVANDVRIVPIFAHANLRRLAFGSTVKERFSPAEYPTEFEENKLFLKRALAKYIPQALLERGKTDFSVPSYLIWLLSPANAAFIRDKIASVSRRGPFRPEVVALIVRIWEKALEAGAADSRSLEKTLGPTADGYLRILWKLLSLEVWYREFVDATS